MSIESRSKQYGSIFGNWHIGRRLDDGSNNKSAVFELYRNSNGWTEQSALKVIGLIEERGSWDKLTPYRWNEYSTAAREVRSSAEQEVRLMEQLRSQTHIVDYLDHSFFDWRDETGFGVDLLIRMELLNCLRTEMRAGRQFDDAEIIKIGKDICSALVLCHEKNIIHRDIKPENIFFNSNGDYKLGDFGISRIIKESPSAMASTGVGTPAYAAPEQSSGAYDKRVDIYSLGLVLYELCNGNRLPFARSSYVGEGEIRLRMSGTPLPLPGTPISVDPFMTHDANPSGNPDKTATADPYATKKARHSEKLIRVIMKACAFRPEDRFATAQEMLDALMDKTPDPSPNPSLSSSPNSNPSLNPNPPKIITGIAICAVLLILAAGVSWWIRKHRPDPNPTPEPTLEATPEPTAEPTPEPTPTPTSMPTPEPTPTQWVEGNWDWSLNLNDYVLTITGTGNMKNYDQESTPWHNGDWIRHVVIEEGITGIGNSAFDFCDRLSSVVIPDGVTYIGDRAFLHCYRLSSVTIPDSVTIIGDWAFAECSGLENVTIPDGVTIIGKGSFDSCYGLTSVAISRSVSTIGAGTFNWCNSLTDIYYTGTKEQWAAIAIGEENEPLLKATIHYNSTAPTPIPTPTPTPWVEGDWDWSLKDGVLTISGTGNMKDYEYLDDVPWYIDESNITRVIIKDGITGISGGAFWYCDNLTSVEIPDSVSSIGSGAFNYCFNLTSFTIPPKVTYIGYGTFGACGGLTSITIPAGVTYIGENAFGACVSLKDIYFAGTPEQWNAIDIGAENDPLYKATIHYNSN